MKRKLHLKILTAYLIFAVLAIGLLSTLTQNLTNQFLRQNEAQQMYRESTLMASDLKDAFLDDSTQIKDIRKSLESAAKYMSAEIWITDVHGNLYFDSNTASIQTLAEQGTPKTIDGFNIQDFGNNYYQTGNFYSSFDEKTLTVFSTITNNYQVQGYVLIHKPMTEVLAQSTGIVDIAFLSVAIVLICAAILLVVFNFMVYKPIQKITNVAENYARGDFSQKIAIASNDEIGYLAGTLNYMATELDSFEEEQRKFVSNVSHDFRSPLTSIKGYIEAMLDGTIPVEMQERYLNIILFETERLNKLTQNMLDLKQFGKRGLSLDITRFDINQIIQNSTLTFEGICSKKGLSFDLQLTGSELFVKGDMVKIQQVLYNLIDNATKFANNNTAIIIKTTVRNEKVLISVKDKGIGIPSDSIKKVWKRFYKTDQSRGRDKKGSGLGLAIVKEIVQAHKENINVISTEGVGTEFIFTLPLSEKEI
ncbi:MAG: HAMP domain-containing protein [Agathobacter sp.]|nr:HAMP domain-containing protein [Agathobacter sp.]